MTTKNTRKVLGGIKSITKTETEYMIQYETGEQAKLNILNSHVFKYYMSPTGTFSDYPKPNHPSDTAKINIKKISDYDTMAFESSILKHDDRHFYIHTYKIKITFYKLDGMFSVFDHRRKKIVLKECRPLSYESNHSCQILYQHYDEYFFGGGMQNGRFSHKGEVINIINSNDWADGGVSSPCPFYWSTYGYGVLRNTWQPGIYDFGYETPDIISTVHNSEDFDAFYFFNPEPVEILKDYFELTGRPIFMPEYAFYEAHLNAFNRDYWVKVSEGTAGAILFEDGFYYKRYLPNKVPDKKNAILESLNGENNNYQFSARAMIDRYKKHDMPLGWFIPNDGYGCGYGQSDTLDGDIENLKQFEEYAKDNGVKVALWTESNLEPADPEHPKKGERDMCKEVGIAGVVALKCDVAWIGKGYSFALNAVQHATELFAKAVKNKVRPMIIMVDGWAGTQRYSGVWSGDQYGGKWEYIRFHIPTYIGAGLSGLPIVGSDMDGIFGGENKAVNLRDYQWKTFTPLQLNMDGWGETPKAPFSFDDEATKINRAYLKMKSMLMPYNYTLGYESTRGLPMIRAMFLEFPMEPIAYTNDCQYQFMWGPWILVAPIYEEKISITNYSIRDGILLPDSKQVWLDLFTGKKYRGGKIYNNIESPLWKIPVFIRDGAIIPLNRANNNPSEIKRDTRIYNVYPNGDTQFHIYEDDGKTCDYLKLHYAKTTIKCSGPHSNKVGDVVIQVENIDGNYEGMIKNKSTIISIICNAKMASKTQHIKAAINKQPITITQVESKKDFEEKENVFYFDKEFMMTSYLDLEQLNLKIKIQPVDITSTYIHVKIKDFENTSEIFGDVTDLNKSLHTPSNFAALEDDITATSVTVSWTETEDASYYEIERDNTIFTNVLGTKYTFEGFKSESKHSFRIRAVNDNGVTKWSQYVSVDTKESPIKHAVQGVVVSCNIPCQPSQEVCKLTDGDCTSLWHTDWNKPGEAGLEAGKAIKLNFDLGDTYNIDRIEYTPRADAGNGTFLLVQYKYSIDGRNWSTTSSPIKWNWDETVKTILLHGKKFGYMELTVLNAVRGFGSGKHMHFIKKE